MFVQKRFILYNQAQQFQILYSRALTFKFSKQTKSNQNNSEKKMETDPRISKGISIVIFFFDSQCLGHWHCNFFLIVNARGTVFFFFFKSRCPCS